MAAFGYNSPRRKMRNPLEEPGADEQAITVASDAAPEEIAARVTEKL
jgi:hypothetical protein